MIKTSRLFISLLSMTLTPLSINAQTAVCYTPVWGGALTACTPELDADGTLYQSCPGMLGQFKILLEQINPESSDSWLKLRGPLQGTVNPDQSMDHILADREGRGLIYSFGDTLTDILPLNKCELQVRETINIRVGTGDFAGAYGTLTVTGILNQCTGLNELDIVREGGEICFDNVISTDDSEH